MVMTVVASGESAKDWTPHGISIGSNDCQKHGKPVDILILVNRPGKFTLERLRIIKMHKGEVLTNSVNQWKTIFPQAKKLDRMVAFSYRIHPGTHYTSTTSPIICLSHAIALGATEIVMYGVDFITHKTYSKGTKAGNHEINVYKKFFKAVDKLGIKMYLGAYNETFYVDMPIFYG